MKKNNWQVRMVIFCVALLLGMKTGHAAQLFAGDKSAWHGFDRYDFVMDDQTLAVTPSKALPDEGNGIKDPAPGQHRCIVVVPAEPAPGNPWSWRGCYWDHQPQTEIELLHRGFCIAYISASATLRPGKEWDAWYAFLTAHGLSAKPAFIGMSRGGEFSYTWATAHPDKVSCIYADNPGINPGVFMGLQALATNDVPLLHVCGSIDPIFGIAASPIENIYQQFGGRISTMVKEGRGHHPHSLNDPKPIADFIENSVKEAKSAPPAFVGDKFVKSHYYSLTNIYQNFPAEGTYITLRGPLFTPCYDSYLITLPNVESFSRVIVPNTPAPGNPWVFRAGYVDRNEVIDQELLAKGFYIVTVAVPYNADGPTASQWDLVYRHLTANGFSKKPVMSGNGGGAGEAYAWACANPGKVSCVYVENPLMHSNVAETQPLDNLAPLAKAGVPLLHACGSLDPWYADNTRVLEERYQALGGQITVMVDQGRGHYPLAPVSPQPAIDFILKAIQ
jgi:hypothetical protein